MEVSCFYFLFDVLYFVYELLGSNIIVKRKKNGKFWGVRYLFLIIICFCFIIMYVDIYFGVYLIWNIIIKMINYMLFNINF